MNASEPHLLARLNDELSRATTIGRSPSAIYLGSTEYKELEKIALQFVFGFDGEYGKSLTWNGLGVYHVDAPSHIGFGFSPDSPCS